MSVLLKIKHGDRCLEAGVDGNTMIILVGHESDWQAWSHISLEKHELEELIEFLQKKNELLIPF